MSRQDWQDEEQRAVSYALTSTSAVNICRLLTGYRGSTRYTQRSTGSTRRAFCGACGCRIATCSAKYALTKTYTRAIAEHVADCDEWKRLETLAAGDWLPIYQQAGETTQDKILDEVRAWILTVRMMGATMEQRPHHRTWLAFKRNHAA